MKNPKSEKSDGILSFFQGIFSRDNLWLFVCSFISTIIFGSALLWLFQRFAFIRNSTMLASLASISAAIIVLICVFAFIKYKRKKDWEPVESSPDSMLTKPKGQEDVYRETEQESDAPDAKRARHGRSFNKRSNKLLGLKVDEGAEKHSSTLFEKYRNSLDWQARIIAYRQNNPYVLKQHVEEADEVLKGRKRNLFLQLGVAVGGAFLGAAPEGFVNAWMAKDIDNIIIFLIMGFVGFFVVVIGMLKS